MVKTGRPAAPLVAEDALGVPLADAPVSLWPLLALLLALLLVSFLLANAIAWWLQLRRARRIAQKTQQLAQIAPSDSKSADINAPLVPVTILTGFLGVGKTTLLNRILLAPDVPFKVMVLENEVGAISIDHSLLQRRRNASDAALEDDQDEEDDGIYVLQNGCMCCLSRGTRSGTELERIVDYLLRVSKEKGFDYLVVETTGLADPGPIIETFLRLRASRFRLDAIVAMVDAHATQRYWVGANSTYKFPIELQRQLLYADIVALNKVDLATDEEIQRLERAITDMNEEATLYRCENADLDLTQIIDVNTFNAVKFRQAAGNEHEGHDGDGHEHKDEHILARGSHTDGVTTVHFEVDAPVDIAVFGEWYGRINLLHTIEPRWLTRSIGRRVWHRLTAVVNRYSKADVLRIKGILAVDGEDRKCIVQCVLDTYTIAPSEAAWAPTERRASKLVMIGERLDRAELEDGFRRCLVSESGAVNDGDLDADAAETKKER